MNTLTQNDSFVLRGPKNVERPLTVAAEPVMNAQAALDDERKLHARLAQMKRAEAAEHDRRANVITHTLVALAGAVAVTERVA